MVAAVSLSRVSTKTAPVQPSPALNLDAELAKYQNQLADWVHCPSCKTPEGKAKIEEISTKISAIESKMKQVDQASVSIPGQAADIGGMQNKPPTLNADIPERKSSSFDGLGTYVDLYA